MKKKLITVDNLEDYVCRASDKFYVDGTVILTPGARDELRKRGISVVPGPAPEGAACHPMTHEAMAQGSFLGGAAPSNLEELLVGLAAILKNEYGVNDPAELRALSLQALKTIKDNLSPQGDLHVKIC